MIDYIINLFQTNDVFAGLVGASGIGTLMYLSKNVPIIIGKFIYKQTTVSLTIQDKNPIFYYIDKWLSENKSFKNIRNFNAYFWRGKIITVPGFSRFLLFYEGKPMFIHRYEVEGGAGESGIAKSERITITLLGRDTSIVYRLIEEARKSVDQEDMLSINTYKWGNWYLVQKKKKRDRDTFFLEEGVLQNLEHDLDTFVNSREHYDNCGRPYRRSYMFYGPGGTGKSSLASYVASYTNRDLCVLSVSSVDSDAELLTLITRIDSSSSVLLIEDIDTFDVTSSRTKEKSNNENPMSTLSLSGLLNALDGVIVPEGLIIIMTTNYIDHLDEAIIRKGRVDVNLKLEQISPDAVRSVLKERYPSEYKIIDNTDIEYVLPADLSEYLYKYSSIDDILREVSK